MKNLSSISEKTFLANNWSQHRINTASTKRPHWWHRTVFRRTDMAKLAVDTKKCTVGTPVKTVSHCHKINKHRNNPLYNTEPPDENPRSLNEQNANRVLPNFNQQKLGLHFEKRKYILVTNPRYSHFAQTNNESSSEKIPRTGSTKTMLATHKHSKSVFTCAIRKNTTKIFTWWNRKTPM